MNQPKVSVCIPTYNYGRYIAEAIESVLCQSFADFEILVVDDASTDSTEEILRSFAAQDSRVRYIRHEVNTGMVENWNYCLHEARGEYIKFLFADDYFESRELLEQMVSILDSDDSISLVGCARKFFNSTLGRSEILSLTDRNTLLNGTDVINYCLKSQQNSIGEPSAVMFRKQQALRGFDCRYRQLVDQEMWFHLLEQGRYYHFAEPLCAFRIHNEQQSAVNVKKSVILEDFLFLYDEYLSKPYITAGDLFKRYLWYDYYYKVWKSYSRHQRMSFSDFAAKVRNYGIVRLIVLYPAYRVYKTFLKVARKSRC